MKLDINLSRALRREITKTAKRGPTQSEMAIFKKWEKQARLQQERVRTAAEIAQAYLIHEARA